MKHALSSLLVATALVAPAAFAQTTATTKPVGYESIPLAANQFNIVGLRLQGATVITGALEAIGSTTVTDNDVNFQATLTAGKTYVLELTSGNWSGLVVEVTAGTGNTLQTSPNDLSSIGITAGTTYNLRPALTLEEVFGTTSSVLQKGIVSTLADIVWVPNASGGYNRYFLNSSDNSWHTAEGPLASNIPVVYTDGILIEKRGSAATLTVSGEVKTGSSTVPVLKGFNVISTVYPAGVTLQNIGLDDDVQKGVVSTQADIIWVPNGSGGYSRYFLSTLDNSWHTAEGPVAPANVSLPAAVLIERVGANAVFKLTPPSSYSNL